MIIEFMGLPGVGKSYLGKQIEKEMLNRGVKCISVVERSRTIMSWKLLLKCLHIIIPATAKFKRLREKLVEIASKYASSQAMYNHNSVDIVDYIEQIVFLDYIYTLLQSRRTVYIFDEGIAQQFSNIIVNFGVDVDIIKKMNSMLGKRPKTIYLMYSLDKIKESIELRNRHVCYIDELKGKELDQYLINFQKGCDSISCIINPLKVDRNDDIRTYIDKVVQAVID